MTDSWDRALRAAMAPARELEPTDAEVQRVLAIDRSRAARAPRPVLRLAVAAAAAIALSTALYAVPTTRAGVDDVYSSITGWVSNDGEPAPGRSLTGGDDAPLWVRQANGERRLVAENGDAKLYILREGEDKLSVALGDSVGLTDTVDGWRGQFAEHRLVLLGPGAPLARDTLRPLYGLTARSVEQVSLLYTTGEPTSQSGLHGGFVLLADATRQPQTLVGYDDAGRVLERVDASQLHLRVCRDPSGCSSGDGSSR
jgi:hypothetical protein